MKNTKSVLSSVDYQSRQYLYFGGMSALATLVIMLFLYWMFIAGATSGAIHKKCGEEATTIVSSATEIQKMEIDDKGRPLLTKKYQECVYSFVEKINDPILRFELVDQF